jgi:hypothetical protein
MMGFKRQAATMATSGDQIDFREHPELYPAASETVDVMQVEPYISELLPHFAYDTADAAGESAAWLYEFYVRYKESGEFVGMDVARRLLYRGFTEAKRHTANTAETEQAVPLRPPPASIFWKTYRMVDNDPDYEAMRAAHEAKYQQH